MLNPEIKIEDRKIGLDHPIFFIADIAANHDGDLWRARDLIKRAADAGADAAKFQHFNAGTIVSDRGFRSLGSQALSHQADWSKSVYDVYSDASLSEDWTQTLKETCSEVGITFLSTPYSHSLVDHLDPYVAAYKIGSGDITWTDLLRYIANKKKPVLMATGASSLEDVQRAVAVVEAAGTSELVLMQCNTNYTAEIDNFNHIHLNVLKLFADLFPQAVLGLSDHTFGHATAVASVALGARVIEKHFTDDTCRNGPDHKFSMNPSSWREMVDVCRLAQASLGKPNKKVEENEIQTVVLQRRSLRARYSLPAGYILSEKDLVPLRPCPSDAIPPYEIGRVVGRELMVALEEGVELRWEDLK